MEASDSKWAPELPRLKIETALSPCSLSDLLTKGAKEGQSTKGGTARDCGVGLDRRSSDDGGKPKRVCPYVFVHFLGRAVRRIRSRSANRRSQSRVVAQTAWRPAGRALFVLSSFYSRPKRVSKYSIGFPVSLYHAIAKDFPSEMVYHSNCDADSIWPVIVSDVEKLCLPTGSRACDFAGRQSRGTRLGRDSRGTYLRKWFRTPVMYSVGYYRVEKKHL
ncbi:hypothetical protein F4818DRAFT_35648 [Hypoxylon cercidicola]|nr:hypothetical protein F4818DRAFT_35648 [Hypoxylon cercidicola]